MIAYVNKHSPDRVGIVKKALSKVALEVLADYDKYVFMAVNGDEFEGEGHILIHKTINANNEKGDQIGDICEMIVFKDGLVEEKVVSNFFLVLWFQYNEFIYKICLELYCIQASYGMS